MDILREQTVDQVSQFSANGDPTRAKHRVVHILNDLDVGGIKTVISSMANSRLTEHYHFSFYALSEAICVRAFRADLIMFHSASNWTSILKILVIKILNPRATLMIHEHHYTGAFEKNVTTKKRFRSMLKLNYALVDSVVAVSKGQGDWIRDRELLASKKLTVIPQSCLTDAFYKLPFKPFDRQLVLAAYGRFHRQKGFDIVIKAAEQLPEVRFLLGGLGPEEGPLREMSKGLANIEFCGLIKDVPRFLEGCHAVLIPSRYEPYGLVALEARAAGKPIIVSDVDGLPEQAHSCGFVVKSEEVTELVAAINKLDKTTIKALSKYARESTIGGWDTYIDRWLALYKKLIIET